LHHRNYSGTSRNIRPHIAWDRLSELARDVTLVRIVQPYFSEEHYALYRRYQEVRHADGGMNQEGSAQYVEFMVQSRVDSFMVEFREPASHDTPNELRMVSIVDKLSDGLSAVYTFYDPDRRQSLGTFNVLWQIKHALALGLPYLYLGYWIEQSRKMSYKSNFQPFDILQEGRWIANSSMALSASIFTK
jgi:arginine-tRNA-protein transferase